MEHPQVACFPHSTPTIHCPLPPCHCPAACHVPVLMLDCVRALQSHSRSMAPQDARQTHGCVSAAEANGAAANGLHLGSQASQGRELLGRPAPEGREPREDADPPAKRQKSSTLDVASTSSQPQANGETVTFPKTGDAARCVSGFDLRSERTDSSPTWPALVLNSLGGSGAHRLEPGPREAIAYIA
jgi:hypothetical protein